MIYKELLNIGKNLLYFKTGLIIKLIQNKNISNSIKYIIQENNKQIKATIN